MVAVEPLAIVRIGQANLDRDCQPGRGGVAREVTRSAAHKSHPATLR